jgi:hypothetical protein
LVARPNVRDGESGPICRVSEARVPETEPVP